MSKTKVTLSPYASKYYPVEARFNLNGVGYSLVFETTAEAREWLSARLWTRELVFVDKT